MRGKNVNWTPEQDRLILKGEKVPGTTVQVASRRYRLKTHYSLEVSRLGKKFLGRLVHLKEIGSLPKIVTGKFLTELEKVVTELAGSVRAPEKKE